MTYGETTMEDDAGSAPPISFAEVSESRTATGTTVRPARFWVAIAAAAAVLVAGALIVASNRDVRTEVSGESALTGAPSTEAVVESQLADSFPALKPFADEFSARGVLGEIPIGHLTDASGLIIGGTDFARISELTGIERTGSVDVQDPPSAWIRSLFIESPVAVADSWRLRTAVQETEEFENDLGFSFIDVDRFVSVSNHISFDGDVPYVFPFDVMVLRSDVDTLEESAGDDRIIAIGGAEGEQTEVTPTRPIGGPLRVAVDGARSAVAISGSTPFVEAWLAAVGPTIADEPDLGAAAEVLDRDEALYSVHFEQFDRNLDGMDPEFRGDRPDDDFRIIEEFAAVGIGWSGIGETQQITIVYVFADVDAANASVTPIKDLYSPGPDATELEFTEGEGAETVPDVFVLDDVRTDGRTVVVTGQATAAASPENVTRLLGGLGPLSYHR